MKSLPGRRIFLDFFKFYFITTPTYLVIIIRRCLTLVDQKLAVTLMAKMIFTPLFGDETILGYILGFLFRFTRVVLGVVVLTSCFLLSVICFLTWLTLPLGLFLVFRLYAIPIVAVLTIVHYIVVLPKPLSTLPELTKYDEAESAMSSKLRSDFNSSHFLERLLNYHDVQELIKRLGVDESAFRKSLLTVDTALVDKKTVLELARKLGLEKNFEFINASFLFFGILKTTPIFDKILIQYELTTSLLEGSLDFVNFRAKATRRKSFFDLKFDQAPMGGVNRGWTARPTPTLDLYSEDLTKLAAKGKLPRPIGKDKVVKDITKVLSRSSRQNVILIGDPGCGKTSAVRGIAYQIVEGTIDPSLKFKRLVQLDVGSVTAEAEAAGVMNGRLNAMISEIKACKNIILFVDEIHNLSATLSKDPNTSNLFAVLEPHLSAGELNFIGVTSKTNYKKYIEPNEAFARVFEKVEMREATADETLLILKTNSLELERANQVVITYPAIDDIIKLSQKLVQDKVLPDKAVDLLESACLEAKKTGDKLVTTTIVREILTKQTKIPVVKITENESKKLLELETELHKRIVGQNEAITAVTRAMQRAGAGIRDEGKPIASFLFAGPTGVGKTETAKALAASYFGDEKLMIRFDMSEYQETSSIDRLIGGNNDTKGGILTEAVRQKPFSLILLDEIEKANPSLILLFLQVLDEGRLTDGLGRTIDFTNTMIIATSNVGAKVIQTGITNQATFEELKKSQEEALLEKFTPEFLNRFSGLITFRPLTMEEIKQIVRLKLNKIIKQMADKLVTINFDEAVISDLATRGFDPKWGARPLNRLIADTIETRLSQELLSSKIHKGDTLTINKDFLG